MAIMVTGGAGLIGGCIMRALAERGEDVVCFDLAPPRADLGALCGARQRLSRRYCAASAPA